MGCFSDVDILLVVVWCGEWIGLEMVDGEFYEWEKVEVSEGKEAACFQPSFQPCG